MDAPDLHEEIEFKTGLKATHSHKKGDIRNVKTGKKWSNNIWTIDSGLDTEKDLSKHLNALWKKMVMSPYD
jgi:hypothetical protein